MTRNLFLGADLRPVYAALAEPGRVEELPGVVADVFNRSSPPGRVQRTDFRARARALAGEVEATLPDLIGVQEAAVWRTDDGHVADHLDLLERELAHRGLAYRRAAVVTNSVVALGSSAGVDVGLTDRDAILAREELQVAQPASGSFFNCLRVPTSRGEYVLKRGWAAVDVTLPRGTIRCVTTHLETGSPPGARAVQTLQLGELLAGPARTRLPVVLAGDFNAGPGSATYELARAAGFEDAWTSAHPHGTPGATCCHGAALDDPADELRTRIDLILSRGGLEVIAAATTGEFADGLWSSDHAGVVATLE